MATDTPMQLGMVGLGRMGAGSCGRLMRDGHRCVGYDVFPDAVKALEADGATGSSSLEEFAGEAREAARRLGDGAGRRHHGQAIAALGDMLEEGDVDHRRRQHALRRGHRATPNASARRASTTSTSARAVASGLRARLLPDDRQREGGRRAGCSPISRRSPPAWPPHRERPGRQAIQSQAEYGYYHCGPNGAGHFVKMVHNGIEYGLMAAYAEGLNIIANADIGQAPARDATPRPAPLERPELYQYEIDTAKVAEVWRRGSVVGSWLLDLTARGAAASRRSWRSSRAASRTRAKGAGRRSRRSRQACPAPVLTTALYSRFSSRGLDDSGTVCCPRCVSSSAGTTRRRA